MKKRLPKFSRFYYIVPGVIILVILVGYLGRGWIRFHAEPGLVKMFTGNSVENVLKQQNKALGYPFDKLGLGKPTHQEHCTSMYASRLKTEVYCSASYSAYSNKVSSLTPSLGVRADQLSATLKTKGWEGGNTSLGELGGNIAQGIDWTPDASYSKQVGKISCMAEFTTAFSKPKPEAMAGNITCSRVYYLFGKKACTPATGISYYDDASKRLLFVDCGL